MHSIAALVIWNTFSLGLHTRYASTCTMGSAAALRDSPSSASTMRCTHSTPSTRVFQSVELSFAIVLSSTSSSALARASSFDIAGPASVAAPAALPAFADAGRALPGVLAGAVLGRPAGFAFEAPGAAGRPVRVDAAARGRFNLLELLRLFCVELVEVLLQRLVQGHRALRGGERHERGLARRGVRVAHHLDQLWGDVRQGLGDLGRRGRANGAADPVGGLHAHLGHLVPETAIGVVDDFNERHHVQRDDGERLLEGAAHAGVLLLQLVNHGRQQLTRVLGERRAHAARECGDRRGRFHHDGHV